MVFLSADERILMQGEAELERTFAVQISGRPKGVLCLTNKRMIFEYTQRYYAGLKKASFTFSQSLKSIMSVNIEGNLLSVEFESEAPARTFQRTSKLLFKVKNQDAWLNAFQEAIGAVGR